MLIMLDDAEFMAEYKKKQEVCEKLRKPDLDEFGEPVDPVEGEATKCELDPPFNVPEHRITWFLDLDFSKDDLEDFDRNVLR